MHHVVPLSTVVKMGAGISAGLEYLLGVEGWELLSMRSIVGGI
jgi:hypothetical protein